MKYSTKLGRIALYYKECLIASIAFVHLPLFYLAYLQDLYDAGWLTESNPYNVFVLMAVPLFFMRFKWLRNRIAQNETLANFFEPLMGTWLLSSMWFASGFSFAQAFKLPLMYQSTGSFFILFFAVGLVIYRQKNIRPIFFIRPNDKF